MLKLLYKLGFKKYIDYRIVGDYYDTVNGVKFKKYIKKYYIKKRRL